MKNFLERAPGPVTVYSKKVCKLINSYQVCRHHTQRRLLQSAHPQRGSNDLFYLQQRAMDLSFYLRANHKRYFKTPSFSPGIQHFLDSKLPPTLDQSRHRKTQVQDHKLTKKKGGGVCTFVSILSHCYSDPG